MENQPLISIGIPVYNGGSRIGRAIDSLLAQDYPELEIIISDNASSDNTVEICSQYAEQDQRIHLHKNLVNMGPTLNFEKVLQLAHSTYFMWAADDDQWSPNYVSALVDAYRQTPDAVLSAGRMIGVNEQGERKGTWSTAQSPETAGKSRVEVTQLFLRGHATSWIYGLFKKTILETEVARWKKLPVWGGDIVFLLHLILNYPVTGSDAAVLYKEYKPSGHEPRTAREVWRWRAWLISSLYGEVLSSRVSLYGKYTLLKASITYMKQRFWRGKNREWSLLKELVIPSS